LSRRRDLAHFHRRHARKPFAYAGVGAIGLIALYILGIFLIGTTRRWMTS
jgi:hypothetical protein